MGLVEGPSQLLTEEQWQKAKAKSNEREDSHQPCVICKEPFGLEQQVLLSCTHVFHRVSRLLHSQNMVPVEPSVGPGGCFKNAYELLNLRVLQISSVYKI